MFTAELMDVYGLWDLNEKKVEELLYLLVFVWITFNKCPGGYFWGFSRGSRTNFNEGTGKIYVSLIVSRGKALLIMVSRGDALPL